MTVSRPAWAIAVACLLGGIALLYALLSNRATILITSAPPGAMVSVNDRYAGLTPVTVPHLPPGKHLVKLTKHAYAPQSRAVDVARGRSEVHFELRSEARGKLKVTSEPSEAEVYLDGRLVGATPITLSVLESGSHDVRVQKDHFIPWQASVAVADAEKALHAPLKAKMEDYYLAAIQSNPRDLSNYSELCHYYVTQGRWDDAMNMLQKAIALAASPEQRSSDDLRRFRQEIEKIYFGQFDYGGLDAVKELRPKLEAALESAIESNPRNLQCYEILSSVYKRTGRPEKAFEVFQRGIKALPADAELRVLLGKEYQKRRRNAEAVECFKQALALNPASFDAHYFLAQSYRDLGQRREALDELQVALKHCPDSASRMNTYVSLATVQNYLGQYREAIESWKAAIKLQPYKEVANSWQLQIAYLHLRLGERAAAHKIASDILSTATSTSLKTQAERLLLWGK
ncbi:MAG: PEGA domain-containing protein [Planctomycetes bacterium]|nr:PEGA domain-containing protein [Planctomycetota bacterium]